MMSGTATRGSKENRRPRLIRSRRQLNLREFLVRKTVKGVLERVKSTFGVNVKPAAPVMKAKYKRLSVAVGQLPYAKKPRKAMVRVFHLMAKRWPENPKCVPQHKSVMKMFLKKGVRINSKDVRGRTIAEKGLELPGEAGLECLDFALDLGIDPNLPTKEGEPLLVRAVKVLAPRANESEQKIDVLLARGADLGTRTPHHGTQQSVSSLALMRSWPRAVLQKLKPQHGDDEEESSEEV